MNEGKFTQHKSGPKKR